MKNYPPFEAGKVYHICSHAVKNTNLFTKTDDYSVFLRLFKKFMNPISTLYAFCLMPNHYHLAIKFHDAKTIESIIKTKQKFIKKKEITNIDIEQFLSKTISNFHNSFTQVINIANNGRGKLFQPPPERKIIEDRLYFKRCIIYIHRNPVHHEFVHTFDEWLHSSYYDLKTGSDTFVNNQTVYNVFGNRENFIEAHQKELDRFWEMESFD
jgi:REP element-mobilizing transposase RayT